jgi:hypothetical protein
MAVPEADAEATNTMAGAMRPSFGVVSPDRRETLREIGITKINPPTQKLATIPEPEFRERIAGSVRPPAWRRFRTSERGTMHRRRARPRL